VRDWIASYELRNVNGEPYRRGSGVLFKKAALTSLFENKVQLRYGRMLSLSRSCYYPIHSWATVPDFEHLARTRIKDPRIIVRHKHE